MMKPGIDLIGKCGSCFYYRPIEGTARGECLNQPYSENTAHSQENRYRVVTRSYARCVSYRVKPITNYDRLISKTPEEMARFIRMTARDAIRGGIIRLRSEADWLDWLKSKAEEGET